MNRWIILFRGVNVGGHRKLPMADLRAALGRAGFDRVASYIQSGNVALGSELPPARLAMQVASLVEAGWGFLPDMTVLSATDMRAALDAAPFDAGVDPSRAHLFFHIDRSAPGDIAGLAPEPGDRAVLTQGDIAHYLNTPDGLSQSKLAEALSRRLKDRATARNLRTCRKMLELAE